MMKNNILLFLATIIISYSYAQQKADYANQLENCLTPQDIVLLNEACAAFENKLMERFSYLETGQAYKIFLIKLINWELPPLFFTHPEAREILEKMMVTETFEKVWIRTSEIEPPDLGDLILIMPEKESNEGDSSEYDPYSTRPGGDYLRCMIGKCENEIIISILNTINTSFGINPNITASTMLEFLSDEDYDDPLIRLMIAVGFYFEMGMALEKY